jgi:hypothetical protein
MVQTGSVNTINSRSRWLRPNAGFLFRDAVRSEVLIYPSVSGPSCAVHVGQLCPGMKLRTPSEVWQIPEN